MGNYSRKHIRLKNYDYSQNGAYFITMCVKHRRQGGDALIAPYVELTEYSTVVRQFMEHIPELQTYVIMPNHIHFILLLDNGPMKASAPTSVPQIIRSFKGLVAKALDFSIWQRSYYDHIIRTEQDYQEISDYICTNPIRWMEKGKR